MDVPKEDKLDESVIAEKLDQTVHIDSISQVPTAAAAEQDLTKNESQQVSATATQSTNEEYSTPDAETSLVDLIESEEALILPTEALDNTICNIIETREEDKTESLIDSLEPSFRPPQPTIPTDNGIFEFMTPDEAIELYKKIHASGPPELDWKFYGRRVPGQEEQNKAEEINNDKIETVGSEQANNQTVNTEFDFDEDFGLESEASIINESLQLKKRFEPGSDKKTNLSDIMSDIMKESHIDNR